MRTELALYDKTALFVDLSKALFSAVRHKFDCFCVPAGYIKDASEFRENIALSAAVDYPCGNEVTPVRLNSINEAIKRGAQYIDVTLNNAYISDSKYKAIGEDILACRTLCEAKNVEIRVIVEYRLLEPENLMRLCDKLTQVGVKHIVTSTGTMMDDPLDNLITAVELHKKTQLQVIASGPFNKIEHYEIAKDNSLYGIRFLSYHVVDKLFTSRI